MHIKKNSVVVILQTLLLAFHRAQDVLLFKSQIHHIVWCYISGEAAGEIWNWSLLGVKGLLGTYSLHSITLVLMYVYNYIYECIHFVCAFILYGLAYQQIVIAIAPKIVGKLPKNTISRNYKITNKRPFFCVRKNSWRMCHYEVKCRKALWLQAREALQSNCKRTQSSK